MGLVYIICALCIAWPAIGYPLAILAGTCYALCCTWEWAMDKWKLTRDDIVVGCMVAPFVAIPIIGLINTIRGTL
jgi:hypothetical protein